MQTVSQQQPHKRRNPVSARKQALESLVYEVLDGRPLYYRGYEDVLAGRKSPEDIMGSTSITMGTCFLFYGNYDLKLRS